MVFFAAVISVMVDVVVIGLIALFAFGAQVNFPCMFCTKTLL